MWAGFALVDALVGDFRPCILGAEEIHGAVHLSQQVAFNDVLVGEVGFRGFMNIALWGGLP